MKKLTLLILLATTSIANAQYGGPPMWDRDYDNPEYRRYRNLPPLPPRRFGPQMEPCIYRGDCRGPRYEVPRFRYPPPY